jgi:hypothetical protein
VPRAAEVIHKYAILSTIHVDNRRGIRPNRAIPARSNYLEHVKDAGLRTPEAALPAGANRPFSMWKLIHN